MIAQLHFFDTVHREYSYRWVIIYNHGIWCHQTESGSSQSFFFTFSKGVFPYSCHLQLAH